MDVMDDWNILRDADRCQRQPIGCIVAVDEGWVKVVDEGVDALIDLGAIQLNGLVEAFVAIPVDAV